MNYKLIDLKVFGDERGRLIPFEKGNNCPFDVKRCFYIYNTSAEGVRGKHANRNSEFLMIAVSGSCKVKIDDGAKQEIIELKTPQQALYLGRMVWKEMYDFSPDSVLLVLANMLYDENEYIRDYDKFLKEVVK